MNYLHIMLIDDDYEDQEMFLLALQEVSESTTCFVANNAVQAMEQLNGESILPELIFLDLKLPMISGQQFLQELKNIGKFSGIPVILLSTSFNEDAISEGEKMGVRDFIIKPNSFSELKDVLLRLLL